MDDINARQKTWLQQEIHVPSDLKFMVSWITTFRIREWILVHVCIYINCSYYNSFPIPIDVPLLVYEMILVILYTFYPFFVFVS